VSEDRVAYVQASRAAREAISRAATACEAGKIRPGDYRALTAVIAMTATYSKVRDKVFVAQLAEIIYGTESREHVQRWMKRKTGASLGRLKAAEVIDYTPSSGPGERSEVSLPCIPEAGTCPESGYDPAPQSGVRRYPRSGDVGTPDRGYLPRRSFEKSSEGRASRKRADCTDEDCNGISRVCSRCARYSQGAA
jgi:hypothetical protein